jgi:hypothetical protein
VDGILNIFYINRFDKVSYTIAEIFFSLGFEFREIFLIENQFPAIAEVRSHRDWLKGTFFKTKHKNFGISTLLIGDRGSQRLSASAKRGVVDSPHSAIAGSRFSITNIKAKIENVSAIM